MPSKTITISAAKWTRVKEAFCAKFPIPKIPDPNDTNKPPNMIDEFTEAEWVFIYIKRYFARIVRSHEVDRKGKDNAPAFDENMIEIT